MLHVDMNKSQVNIIKFDRDIESRIFSLNI